MSTLDTRQKPCCGAGASATQTQQPVSFKQVFQLMRNALKTLSSSTCVSINDLLYKEL